MKQLAIILVVWAILAGAIGFFSFRYIFESAVEDGRPLDVSNSSRWKDANDAIRRDAENSAISAAVILSTILTGYATFRALNSGKNSGNLLATS